MPRRYSQRDWTAATIDNSMDFCRSAAARATDCFGIAPFSASGRAVCFCGGAIDHMDVPIGRLHQSFKQAAAIFLWLTSDGSDCRQLLEVRSRLDNPAIGNRIAGRG
ncbi:hypothetical protein BFS10_02365 [Brucella suis]|nr:hypothetical protein BFS10_02365 [Brucella suis]